MARRKILLVKNSSLNPENNGLKRKKKWLNKDVWELGTYLGR